MSTGVERIAAERQRQIDVEGYTPEHDAAHHPAELAQAAATYALHAASGGGDWTWEPAPWPWPWKTAAFKGGDRIRMLEKAGALIAADIDRLLATPASSVAAGQGEVRRSGRKYDYTRHNDWQGQQGMSQIPEDE